jgi:hypothetical protein
MNGEQSNDGVILDLLKKNTFFQPHEKEFLSSRIASFDHLDKFKLKRYLIIDDQEILRATYKLIREKVLVQETEQNYQKTQNSSNITKDILDKINARPDTKKPISISLLANQEYLGGVLPETPQVRGQHLDSLVHLNSLDQLAQLDSSHVTFSLDDNAPLIMQNLFKKLSQLFDRIEDVNLKRGYFRLFMRSELFNAYLNTGITALRHTEIQPRKLVLNLIFQIDPGYLNAKQFEYTASISDVLKNLADL